MSLRVYDVHVRLKACFHGIEGILWAVSGSACVRSFLGVKRTATTVDNRLLELAATSVLYLLVHRFACSLRSTARDTSVRSLGGPVMVLSCCLFSSCSGILAIASCGRRGVFLRQSRLGQYPPKLHQDRCKVRLVWGMGVRDSCGRRFRCMVVKRVGQQWLEFCCAA